MRWRGTCATRVRTPAPPGSNRDGSRSQRPGPQQPGWALAGNSRDTPHPWRRGLVVAGAQLPRPSPQPDPAVPRTRPGTGRLPGDGCASWAAVAGGIGALRVGGNRLQLSEAVLPPTTRRNMAEGVPVLSPLAWPLAYRWPVHRMDQASARRAAGATHADPAAPGGGWPHPLLVLSPCCSGC